MASSWWTVDNMEDTLKRIYGYGIPLAPVHLVGNYFYLCSRNTVENSVTYGYDKLSMDLVYEIVLAHLRPLILKKCSEVVAKDGREEYSSKLFGLTTCGEITDLAGNTIVEFSPDDHENVRSENKQHVAADELYALLNLLRITYRGNISKLPYNTKLGNPQYQSIRQQPSPGVETAPVYTGPDLLP